jgi:hypothetical protein
MEEPEAVEDSEPTLQPDEDSGIRSVQLTDSRCESFLEGEISPSINNMPAESYSLIRK